MNPALAAILVIHPNLAAARLKALPATATKFQAIARPY